MTARYPPNLVLIALWQLDPTLLTSADGNLIQVNLDAVCKLLENPPPMLRGPREDEE